VAPTKKLTNQAHHVTQALLGVTNAKRANAHGKEKKRGRRSYGWRKANTCHTIVTSVRSEIAIARRRIAGLTLELSGRAAADV